MKDKMHRKNKTGNFLDKTKNAFSDLGNKIKGTAHKTVDEEFDTLVAKFHENKKKIDVITGDVVSFCSAIEVLLNAQDKSATHLRDLFPDDSGTNVNALCLQQINMTDKMKDEKGSLDKEIETTFQTPVHTYLSQYREMEDRIKERSRRMEKLDKLHDKLARFKEKEDVRTSATELKLRYAEEAYGELNRELIQDIPRLFQDCDVFFTPIMHNLIFTQGNFWNLMSRFVQNLTQTTGVTTSQPVVINQVITPRDRSSVVRTYSALTNPYNNQQSPVNPYAQTNAQPQTNVQQPARAGLPPLPSRPTATERVRAQWAFQAVNPTELSFNPGDILTILEKPSDWWRAELNGRTGLIPSNYVQPA